MATKIQISRGNLQNKQKKDTLLSGELFWVPSTINDTSNTEKYPWDEGTLWVGNPSLKEGSPLPIAGGKFLSALSYKGEIEDIYNITDSFFDHVRSGDFYIWKKDAPYDEADPDKCIFKKINEFNKGDILLIESISSILNDNLDNIDTAGKIIDHNKIVYRKISCSFGNVNKIKFTQENGEKWPQFEATFTEGALLETQYEKLQWVDTITIEKAIPTDPVIGGLYLIDSDSIKFTKNTDKEFIAYKGDFVVWTKNKLFIDDKLVNKEYNPQFVWKLIPSGAHSSEKVSYFNTLNQNEQALIEAALRKNHFSNTYIESYKQNATNVFEVLKYLSINTPQLDEEGHILVDQLPEEVLGALKYIGVWTIYDTQYPISELEAHLVKDPSKAFIYFDDLKYYAALPEVLYPSYVPQKGDYWVVNSGSFSNILYKNNTIPQEWIFSSGDWIIYDGMFWNKIDHTNGVRAIISENNQNTSLENEWVEPTEVSLVSHIGAPTVLASHKIGIAHNSPGKIEIVGENLVNQKISEDGKETYYPRYTNEFNQVENSFLQDIIIDNNTVHSPSSQNKTIAHSNFEIGSFEEKRTLQSFGNIIVAPHNDSQEEYLPIIKRSALVIQAVNTTSKLLENISLYAPNGENEFGIIEKKLDESINVILPHKTSTLVGKLPVKDFSQNFITKSVVDGFIESSKIEEHINTQDQPFELIDGFQVTITNIEGLSFEQLNALQNITNILAYSPSETIETISSHIYPWVIADSLPKNTFDQVQAELIKANIDESHYTIKAEIIRKEPPIPLKNIEETQIQTSTPIVNTFEINLGEYDKSNTQRYDETSFEDDGTLNSNYNTHIIQNKFQQASNIDIVLPTDSGHLFTQENYNLLIGNNDDSYIPVYGQTQKIDIEGKYDTSTHVNVLRKSPIRLITNFLRNRISTSPELESGFVFDDIPEIKDFYTPKTGDGSVSPTVDSSVGDINTEANIIAGIFENGKVITEKSVYATKALGVGNDTHVEGFINPPRTKFPNANQYKNPYTNENTLAKDVEVDMPNESGVLLTSNSRIVGNENTIQVANGLLEEKLNIANHELFYDNTNKDIYIGENNNKKRFGGQGSIIWKGCLKTSSGSTEASAFPVSPQIGDAYILKEDHFFSTKEDVYEKSPFEEIETTNGLKSSEFIAWHRGGIIIFVDNQEDWLAKVSGYIGSDSRWNGWIYLNNKIIKDYNILASFEGIERLHDNSWKTLPFVVKNLYDSGFYDAGKFGEVNQVLSTEEHIEAGTYKLYIGEDVDNAIINGKPIFIKKNSIVTCQADKDGQTYINTISLGYTESGSIDFSFTSKAFLENKDYRIVSKDKDQTERILTDASKVTTVTQALDWLNTEKADLSVNGKIPITQIPETLIGALQFKSTILLENLNPTYTNTEFADYLRALYKDQVDDDQHGEDYTLDDGDYVIFTKNIAEDIYTTIGGIKYNTGDWAIYHLINGEDTFDRINSSASTDNVNGKIGAVVIKGDRGIYVDNSGEDIRITSTSLLHDEKGIPAGHLPIIGTTPYEVVDSNLNVVPSSDLVENTQITDVRKNITLEFPTSSGQILIKSGTNGVENFIPKFDAEGKLVDSIVSNHNGDIDIGALPTSKVTLHTDNEVSLTVTSNKAVGHYVIDTTKQIDPKNNNISPSTPATILTDVSVIDCGTWLD